MSIGMLRCGCGDDDGRKRTRNWVPISPTPSQHTVREMNGQSRGSLARGRGSVLKGRGFRSVGSIRQNIRIYPASTRLFHESDLFPHSHHQPNYHSRSFKHLTPVFPSLIVIIDYR